MNAQQPMRQHAVHNVPDTKADQEPARKRSTPALLVRLARTPQAPQAGEGNHVHERVEIAVPQNLPPDGIHPWQEAEQVVPLQYLVKENPVEEAAKRKAQHDAPADASSHDSSLLNAANRDNRGEFQMLIYDMRFSTGRLAGDKIPDGSVGGSRRDPPWIIALSEPWPRPPCGKKLIGA